MTLDELELARDEIQARLDILLAASGGEVTDEIDALADELLAADEAVEAKFDAYGQVIRSLLTKADGLEERIAALDARRVTASKTADRLKARLKDYMERKGLARVEGEWFRFRVQANGGVLPLVFDPDAAPAEGADFCRAVWEWDKEEIRRSLEAGHDLPFAHLGERGSNLRIE